MVTLSDYRSGLSLFVTGPCNLAVHVVSHLHLWQILLNFPSPTSFVLENTRQSDT